MLPKTPDGGSMADRPGNAQLVIQGRAGPAAQGEARRVQRPRGLEANFVQVGKRLRWQDLIA